MPFYGPKRRGMNLFLLALILCATGENYNHSTEISQLRKKVRDLLYSNHNLSSSCIAFWSISCSCGCKKKKALCVLLWWITPCCAERGYKMVALNRSACSLILKIWQKTWHLLSMFPIHFQTEKNLDVTIYCLNLPVIHKRSKAINGAGKRKQVLSSWLQQFNWFGDHFPLKWVNSVWWKHQSSSWREIFDRDRWSEE